MKAIKKINNNVALCVDSKGKEVVAFGKGIGFLKMPYEVELNRIERTFYNLNHQYISMLNEISYESLQIADKVINYAVDKLLCELNGNLLFSLADHIDFAIERQQKNMKVGLPILNDIERLYEMEMEIGHYALKLVREELGIELPEEEAALIAINIINSEYNSQRHNIVTNDKAIQMITEMIEEDFHISINRKSFSYSRFVMHMYYLFKRESENTPINTNNRELFHSVIATYPVTWKCIRRINAYFEASRNWRLPDEECLYLMLHVNRLVEKEE